VNRRIIIAGASGFIGQELVKRFRSDGSSVQLIGRTGPDARWGATAAITDLLEGADALINLAGKSVNCRYNAKNRAEIFRSRLDTTRELARAMGDCEHPPAVWFNASTATIYRHAEDRPMDERSGELGAGFSVEVATSWEQAFFEQELPGVRRIALRMAIVLGRGSVMVPLQHLVRFGLGGPQRDGRWFSTAERRQHGTYHHFGARGGRQKFSWVHLDDVYGSIRFLMERGDISGVVNIVSPQAADNRTLMSTLRRTMSVPFGLPAFRWMLEVGSAVIGTETELVLKSRWVHPARLLDGGYEFRYRELEPALRSIITNTT
jgi:NAD dependent epimerase/dehydratase family enzyme